MGQIHKEHLQAGYIYGDYENNEYIYLPAGEVGVNNPMCIFEKNSSYEDIPIEEACKLINRLSLKECSHPSLGKRSF